MTTAAVAPFGDNQNSQTAGRAAPSCFRTSGSSKSSRPSTAK